MTTPERTLYPSRKKWLALLAVSLVFVLLGLAMVADSRLLGWFPVCFFGLVAAVGGVSLMPGSAHLRLTSEGFEQRAFFRSHTEPWTRIHHFEAYTNPTSTNRFVGIVYEIGGTSPPRKGTRLSRSLAGVDGALPDTYGMSADELASLMNEWLRRFKSD